MWKRLKNTDFYLSFTFNDVDCYNICVTDYVTLWFACLSKTDFLECLKKSNSRLEMPDDAMLQKGLIIMSNPTDLKNVDTKVDNSQLIVSMTKLFGYPFKLQLTLNEGSKELFFNEVTKPMLKIIQDMKSCRRELCNILKKKDSEIEEYKCDGGEIVLRHLKTKKFNEDEFLNKHTVYENYFGTEDLIDSLVEKNVTNPESISTVKVEFNGDIMPKIKVEPDSQVTEGQQNTNISSTVNVKLDPETSIKYEPLSYLTSPRKKVKKLNL